MRNVVGSPRSSRWFTKGLTTLTGYHYVSA